MKKLHTYIFVLCLLLSGAAVGQEITTDEHLSIDTQYTSRNFDNREIFLIYHHTAGNMISSYAALMGIGGREVSAHFLVNDSPGVLFPNYVYRLVPEDKRAWHAGVSSWKTRVSLNASSLGIEIVNKDGNIYEYKAEQIKQFTLLGKYIMKKYNILPQNVLGHSDIAPDRKNDPGILFPWKELAQEGIGIWPKKETIEKYKKSIARAPDVKTYQTELSAFGYNIDATGAHSTHMINVIIAFQRHFRPQLADGNMDVETYVILKSLLEDLSKK